VVSRGTCGLLQKHARMSTHAASLLLHRPTTGRHLAAAVLPTSRPGPLPCIAVERRRKQDFHRVVGREVVGGRHLLAIECEGLQRRLVRGFAGDRNPSAWRSVLGALQDQLEAAAGASPIPRAGPCAKELLRGGGVCAALPSRGRNETENQQDQTGAQS